MLKKIKQIITSSEALSVSIFSGISTFVKLCTAFITSKIVAIYLGPDGLGVIGQLGSFLAIVLAISTGGISNGVVKYLSEYGNEKTEQYKIIKASVVITLISSVIVSIFIILFSGYWSEIIFKGSFQSVIIILGISIIFYALFNLSTNILNGLKEYKKFNYIGIISSLTGLIFSVFWVKYFGIYGALLSLVTYQSVVFFIIFLFKNKIAELKYLEIIKVRINMSVIKNLSKFSIMAIISAFCIPVSQILIRNFIATEINSTFVGYYEGINRLSNMYLTLITTTLSIYYLPKLSSLTNSKEVRTEIFNGYKLIIPVTLVILTFVLVFKKLIIKYVFSSQFMEMENLFLPQLIGDFFKIASWLLAFQMLAKAMTITYIVTEVIFSILLVGLTFVFVNYFGGIGVVYSYALNYFLYFIAMIVIFSRLLFKNK